MTWLTECLSFPNQVAVGGLLLLLLVEYGTAADHDVAKQLSETGQIVPIARML
jgi:hypothetical protein